MRVAVHNSLRDYQELQATQVVVTSDLGDPIAVVLESAPGSYVVLNASDEQFSEVVAALGYAMPDVVPYSQSGSLILPE